MRAHPEHRWLFIPMGRLSLVLVLLCGIHNPAHAFFPYHDGPHKKIEALELEWRQAQVTNNVAELDRLLSDDYLGVTANGTLETKADELTKRRGGFREANAPWTPMT
jgi:hypothetical protein